MSLETCHAVPCREHQDMQSMWAPPKEPQGPQGLLQPSQQQCLIKRCNGSGRPDLRERRIHEHTTIERTITAMSQRHQHVKRSPNKLQSGGAQPLVKQAHREWGISTRGSNLATLWTCTLKVRRHWKAVAGNSRVLQVAKSASGTCGLWTGCQMTAVGGCTNGSWRLIDGKDEAMQIRGILLTTTLAPRWEHFAIRARPTSKMSRRSPLLSSPNAAGPLVVQTGRGLRNPCISVPVPSLTPTALACW